MNVEKMEGDRHQIHVSSSTAQSTSSKHSNAVSRVNYIILSRILSIFRDAQNSLRPPLLEAAMVEQSPITNATDGGTVTVGGMSLQASSIFTIKNVFFVVKFGFVANLGIFEISDRNKMFVLSMRALRPGLDIHRYGILVLYASGFLLSSMKLPARISGNFSQQGHQENPTLT